jgi:hypothetical protein
LGILVLQPSGNLFRRPVQNQFTRNELLQLHVVGKEAHLGSQGRLPGLVIGFIGSIERSPAMAGDLSAHRRGRSLQTFGYITNRRTASDCIDRLSWHSLSGVDANVQGVFDVSSDLADPNVMLPTRLGCIFRNCAKWNRVASISMS